ncbi:hypothetical protein A3H10_03175 [Candidatus Uhrbacteria bacterium RIFCSPLOWO2_12_FULL_46_10]|uniref:TVP38/TMEM64 family membrane protein n=1 Tax=Candidatus Uhrbacteria bacterium RIFCSPLOWO2_01_FULL_47_25 TaxID=1802402 RepID=A0A1F7UXP0_9BACT|nr:MAG: hypothetical protein UX68_C0030G0014 [Parcubacteria group bacterium GW2011_GWA2_46_9]OGL59725.1 MAG: hypothetical protein A2752_02960 [Candidatus Uhrbacteria bacterium RIFCSPHIGHO2_01_FULL_46_23]OGL70520.1 MAG: hypothetical protein A3D60_03530 [Candidatus Uhrbacteria bacterium RIFCSPHIGHO2_02_FULL_47_29]OGL75145.1 MAG: hypothetical protein A3E96_04380 [Candidatus Uhrbacteria bacterium RIFCSPHIGHO2_12_FULL_46_13]OGL83053.1 MAG: hypothetical protein A2936_05035 [Candidatus Uhrbacteria bac
MELPFDLPAKRTAWERIKYPKLLLLFLTFVVAYILFREWEAVPYHEFLLAYWYLGAFLGGLFFVYGFTAAPATVLLLFLGRDNNLFFIGIIAGLGALVGDLVIFKFIQHSFADEIEHIWQWKIWLWFTALTNRAPEGLRKYVLLVFAGFIIASPLPDEIGVSLLAASRGISIESFAVLSFALNTIGIFLILMLGAGL